MLEKKKIVYLVVFIVICNLVMHALEYDDSNQDFGWQDSLVICVWVVGLITFGLITKHLQNLLALSVITAIVNILFFSADIYYVPDNYQETLAIYENSVAFLLTTFFIAIFILAFMLIGIGMISSYLFKILFNK